MSATLITLNARTSGRVARRVLNGREYLVAPVTLLVSGVLNGSRGPLLYPPEEVAAGPGAWEKFPLVVYHPKRGSEHVSARSPGVLRAQGVGVLLNDRVERLPGGQVARRAEAWFDARKTQQVDARVYKALVNGEPIEVSTGLYTDTDAAPAGSVHNGTDRQGRPYSRPYTHVARRLAPDHLAVLPDQKGACSIADGCGVLVNKAKACGCQTDKPAGPVTRLVGALTNLLRLETNANGPAANQGVYGLDPQEACDALDVGEVDGRPISAYEEEILLDMCAEVNNAAPAEADLTDRHRELGAEAKAHYAGNAFCATGPGGGQDNSCAPGGGQGGGGDKASGDHHPAVVEAVKKLVARSGGANLTPSQMEQQGRDQYFNQDSLAKAFPGKKGHVEAGKAIRQAFEARAHLVNAEMVVNPPSWVEDEDVWAKAKDAAAKSYDEGDDAYWPAVAAIYQKMGGTVGGKGKDTANANPSQPRDPAGRWEPAPAHEMRAAVERGFAHNHPPSTPEEDDEEQARHDPGAVFGDDSTPATQNAEQPTMPLKYSDEQRKQIVAGLVANCECGERAPWKTREEMEAALNAMTDAQLYMVEQGRKALEAKGTQNQAPTPPAQGQQQPARNQATPPPLPPALQQVAQPQRPKSLTEALEQFGTPQEKAVWNGIMEAHDQEKARLVGRLVGNCEGDARQRAVARYANWTLEDLREEVENRAALEPRGERRESAVYNFLGAAGGPAAGSLADEEPLPEPVYNWDRRKQPA